MDMRSINHQVKVKEWRETIAECRRSEKPVKEWCSENCIKTSQYYYWLRVIRNESLALAQNQIQVSQPQFTQVKIKEDKPHDVNSDNTCAIVKGQGFSLEIKNGAHTQTLEQTLRVLNSIC